MALTSIRNVNSLSDPLKMFQIRLTFGDGAKTLSNLMAKVTDKATSWVNERSKIATNHAFGGITGTGAIGVGSIMGPNGIILSKDFELRCTSFTYPGANISTTDLMVYNHSRKFPTYNDKSGTLTVEVVEDMNASVIQAINNWCDVIHNQFNGMQGTSEFYATNAAMDIEDQNGKSQRRIFLHGVWPMRLNPLNVKTSSSDAVTVKIDFNYDWYSEVNTLV